MRIKSIDIKNFRSYYGENNHFEFSDGLTLILGDNGDGKTTFLRPWNGYLTQHQSVPTFPTFRK
ncbi:MAG: AAA family ATPase [Alistipes putredinis]|uniref:AAA family ATPase n=1 Tax=Alistipes putredinis TaxID=28117 RepID=UPI003993A661